MADEWKTDFSIEDDEFAYATVTRNGQTQKHNLGPAGDVVAAAMAWVEYEDWRQIVTDASIRDLADFVELERGQPDMAQKIRSLADDLIAENNAKGLIAA